MEPSAEHRWLKAQLTPAGSQGLRLPREKLYGLTLQSSRASQHQELPRERGMTNSRSFYEPVRVGVGLSCPGQPGPRRDFMANLNKVEAPR